MTRWQRCHMAHVGAYSRPRSFLYSYTSIPSNNCLTAAAVNLQRAGLAEILKLLSHPQSGTGAVNSWVAPFFESFSMLPRKPERTRFAPALALAAGPRRDFSSDKRTSYASSVRHITVNTTKFSSTHVSYARHAACVIRECYSRTAVRPYSSTKFSMLRTMTDLVMNIMP